MSKRVFHEYTDSIRDLTLFREKYLSESTLTESNNEDTMAVNQYYHKFNNYFTFKSDGTKQCGVVFDLNKKITAGDFLKITTELMSIEGNKPSIIYIEGSRVYNLNQPDRQEGFEFVNGEFYITNSTGAGDSKVFIGLDVGESGTFRIRYPRIKHYAQQEYSPSVKQSNTKMFQLSKNNGEWKVDATNSYRRLDPATLSFGSHNILIDFGKPFMQDVPQVFSMTNNVFAGWTVHFGWRSKSQVELHFYDNTGVHRKFNEVPDGAIINVMAIAGLYY